MNNNKGYINRGYHSFINKQAAKRTKKHYGENRFLKIKKFIIPAGTLYYVNFDNDVYVSERILMK